MGVDYSYYGGYGFLLPVSKAPLPEPWTDVMQWWDEDVNRDVYGTGMTPVLSSMMGSDMHWGFVATETLKRLDRYTNHIVTEIPDINPTTVSSVYDMARRVEQPRARIGWMMWMHVS